MDNHCRLTSGFSKKIKSYELSYLFAKQMNHGLQYKTKDWLLFEPSRFIYSFFALNMVYDIDWDKSFRECKVCPYHYRINTTKKIISSLDFIYSHNDVLDFKSCFYGFDNSLSLIANSKDIEPDENINRIDTYEDFSLSESYFNNYLSGIESLKHDNFNQSSHYKLLIFTYQIRNNIFHGLKTIDMMSLEKQRLRIIDYTNIILVTLEQFFELINKRYNYSRAKNDDISQNFHSFSD